MIQVSFAWQTWWRLPILMVGSGSKEKNPGLLHTGIFDQNMFSFSKCERFRKGLFTFSNKHNCKQMFLNKNL